MKSSINLFLILTLFLFLSLQSYGQQVGEYGVVKTKDRNLYKGELLEINEDSVVIKDQNLGKVKIIRASIKSIKKSTNFSIVNGDTRIHSSASTRYFLAPSSFALEKNEAYYHNIGLIYNHMSYGATKNFTIGATIIPLPFFNDFIIPVGLSVKYSTPITENLRWSAGGLGFTVLLAERDSKNSGGVLGYTGLTYGDKRNNISAGYGINNTGTNIILLSGSARLSNNFNLISDNYIRLSGNSFAILGARYIGRILTFDFGLAAQIKNDDNMTQLGAGIFYQFTVPLNFGKNRDLSPQKKIKKSVRKSN